MTRHCWRCAAPLPAPPPLTCPSCGEIHYVNPKPCGDAVVVDGDAILLVRRARDPDIGLWDVPGGFCELDEHPMHAAERELCEEAGVRGRAFAHVGTWMDVYGPPADDGLQIHTTVTSYLVALVDPSAPLRPDPAESTDARWFALDALPSPLAFEPRASAMLAAARALLAAGVSAETAAPLPDRTW